MICHFKIISKLPLLIEMNDLIMKTAKLRPNFMGWIGNYLKFWFHMPYYNGEEGEIGEGGVIRLLAHVREKILLSLIKFYSILDFIKFY